VTNKPSAHLLIHLVVIAASICGYGAIYLSSLSRGYAPSLWPVARNLLVLIGLIAVFVALLKGARYRGNLTIFTAAFFLFAVGSVAQYRLFSDPEYVARLAGKQELVTAYRKAKIRAWRALAIEAAYDEAKRDILRGSSPGIGSDVSALPPTRTTVTARDFFSSPSTYAPPLAVMALVVSFLALRRESILFWVQRRSLTLALVAFIPLLIVAGLARSGGVLAEMTPWEVGKIVFLISLAGILVDTYGVIRITRWTFPPARSVLPLVVVTAFAILPFFVLSDFGQLMVFLIVYFALYLIAVGRRAQIVHGVILALAIGLLAYSVGQIPPRVFVRWHLWHSTWQAPDPQTEWWQRVLAQRFGPSGPGKISNDELWRDQALQLMQGLFGLTEGGLIGTGLGLGMPETVPISESDFIYAAIAEEMGWIGGVLVVGALLLLGLAGITITLSVTDMFTRLIAAGATCFLVFQALVNIGGVIKLLPMTGITLPFVSHGGWSLVTSFALIGVLMALSERASQKA
jgi:cell division protein FtsW (lipid II flippase)